MESVKESWVRRHIPLTILIILLATGAIISTVGEIWSKGGASRQATVEPVQDTPEMIKLKAESAARWQAAADAAQKASDAAQKVWDESKPGKICAAHPDWSHEDCQLIANAKVRIGMSAVQARASWGTPDDINRTTTARGTDEQWVYDSSYLYFEDGLLTSIQN